ncbi:MAG: OmpA family protein [Chromatiaceae bacterium]|jgi:OOP family OmpA-OmpF porin|nr:OmpA family protein [Chromatiaceae bacterium]
MLNAMKRFASMRTVAAVVLAAAVTSPSAEQMMDETYWYASGDPSVPDGQLWVNSYGECWQSAPPDGPTNLPPCAAVIPEEVTVRLNFEFDKYLVPENVVNPEEIAKIDDYIDQLQGTPENETVTVVGHTDAKGSDEYNMALGQRRADAVRNYIIARGYPEQNVAPAQSEGKRDMLPGVDPYSVLQRRVVLTKTDT